jgi:hypothetical protein
MILTTTPLSAPWDGKGPRTLCLAISQDNFRQGRGKKIPYLTIFVGGGGKVYLPTRQRRNAAMRTTTPSSS